MKIYLSPSMQRANLYAAGGTTEMHQCSRIAESAERALLRNGFEVLRAPMGQSAEDNVAQSNNWGADFHIPIHTNAGGGRGCVLFISSLDGVKYDFARSIFREIDAVTLYPSVYGVRARSFYETVSTRAPCLYVECEFHDSCELAEWIIDNTSTLGEAICRGICIAAGREYIAEESMERWKNIEDVPEGYRAVARRFIDSGALKGKSDGSLDITEDMLRVMEILRRYFEEE
ncbi:MAG: N-acetylmuramoyl-L-alanine amidase [Oscillospiraceae bacterium]|nr:N-acetylmuramoyl-L-alanine amidase [Oscillospiraceae bacterium]